MKTEVYKGSLGWIAETKNTLSGWKITTMVRLDGNIACEARKGKFTENGGFIYFPKGNPEILLCISTDKATQQAVEFCHSEGLIVLFRRHPEAFRQSIRVLFNDGDDLETWFNGTEEMINQYYIGQSFEKEDETTHVATKVEIKG